MTAQRGWTLHEMLISLGVMSAMVALAVHVAVGQLRFFRGTGEIVSVREQLGHATEIAASVLWAVSPSSGDLLVASDSALEVRSLIGTAVTCAAGSGQVTVAAPTTEDGNTLAAFFDVPDADDQISAFLEDTTAADGTWLTLHVAAAPVAGGCTTFGSTSGAWMFPLREQLPVPAGTALRFLRPLRLSLYRASDGRWYMGARDWNGASQRFNTIQPVAGPLQPYSPGADSGLRFSYFDATGGELAAPVAQTTQIASVRIVARGLSVRPVRVPGIGTVSADAFADSAAVTIALRNAQ